MPYNDKTWHRYTLPKENAKMYEHVTHPLRCADIINFLSEVSKFGYIKNFRYRLLFVTKFLIILTFFESSKIFLISTVTILMMSAKLHFSGLLKIKLFQNNGNDVIITGYDVTNKILSRDSNRIVDVNFGDCSISMTEVIITSIL